MKLKPIVREKKGQFDIIVLMVVGFVFFIAAGLIWFVMNLLNEELVSIPELEGNTEYIEAASGTLNILNWGPTTLFVFMIISLFISYYKVGSAPYWFIIHLVVIVLCVILAAMLSNIYYDISIDPDVGSIFINNLTYPTAIMNRLPIIMAVIGFISVVILVSKWAVSGGGQTTYLPPGY